MARRAFVSCCALLGALFMAAAGAEAPGSKEPVLHVSGGIGVDEQERLLAREKEFNLKLVFTLIEGNYLADVLVTITDAKGRKLLEHVAQGPFLLAKLPPGRYTVIAVHEGRAVKREIALAERRLRTEYLRWPANPETDLPVSRWLDPDGEPRTRSKPSGKSK
jgi:hypothetical protein